LQEIWINETLPRIFDEAESCNAVVLFEDEAIFQQSGSISRTWAPIGKGTELKSEPCRESVKTFGAINVTDADKPGWHFRFAEKFNAESFVQFLSQLLRYYGETKIFLILDNALYHKSGPILEWHALHKDRIEFFTFLHIPLSLMRQSMCGGLQSAKLLIMYTLKPR
jgi:hypothetical protein